MATWMAHLRVADGIAKNYPTLQYTAFLMGNIAPDSGVPNADWSAYYPDKRTSHFKEGGEIKPEKFLQKYMTDAQWERYGETQKAFYLGYCTHLLTDCLWVDHIYRPAMKRFENQTEESSWETLWKFKRDWYDLDYLYLKRHPDFGAFLAYEQAEDFKNTFMEEFAEDAFENRRVYITGFYRSEHENLEREYPYLDEAAMDSFVEEAVKVCTAEISRWLVDGQ